MNAANSDFPLSVSDPDLRKKALDRYADGLVKAVSAARSSLLAGNLITLLLVGSLFNSYYSWNYSQQHRRAQLLNLFSEIEATVHDKAPSGSQSLTDPGVGGAAQPSLQPSASLKTLLKEFKEHHPEYSWLERIYQPGYDRELSYLSHLTSSKDLKNVATQELSAHIAREKEQDTLHLPFVNTKFAATDRTIIGGLALALAAAWLAGAIGRQKGIINEFVVRTASGFSLNPEYTLNEHVYILKSLSTSASFSGNRRSDFLLALVGWVLWYAPPISVGLCLVYYVSSSGYFQITAAGRTLVEISAVILVLLIWLLAKSHDKETVDLLKGWEATILDKRNPRKCEPEATATLG